MEADPDGKLYEQFLSAAYKVHPYGRPILGWTQDIMNLSPDAVKNIFAEYRAPESIVIAVVGDINPQETLQLIEKYFGRIPANNKRKNWSRGASANRRKKSGSAVRFQSDDDYRLSQTHSSRLR